MTRSIRRRCAATAVGAVTAAAGIALTTVAARPAQAATPTASSLTTTSRSVPADQVSATTFADRMVRAWGRGDHSAVSYYATSSVRSRLFAHADPGGRSWARVGTGGAAGTTYVTYRDTASGARVTVGVSDVVLGEGGAHAASTLRV